MQYAIVHKNRVVLGPLSWAQKYFTDILKIRYRIQANVPGQPPEEMPYEIDKNTKIYQILEEKPDFDAMTEYLHGPHWDLSDDILVAKYTIEPQPIESARNNFRVIAATERYIKEVGGVKISLQGTKVTGDTSREGRHVFIQKLMLMGDSDIVGWKFPEGWFNISKMELAMIVQAGAQHIQSAFEWEKEINNQIDAAENGEQLHAIEIIKTEEKNADVSDQ